VFVYVIYLLITFEMDLATNLSILLAKREMMTILGQVDQFLNYYQSFIQFFSTFLFLTSFARFLATKDFYHIKLNQPFY